MSDFIDDKPVAPAPTPKRKEREERPKFNIKEDLDYRIKGLEQAKLEPGMSRGDIDALDRVIVKLREKKVEKNPKPDKEQDQL